MVLDDTHRPDEQQIVRLWSELGPSPTRLAVLKDVGSSTVMRVEGS